ncbi:hypothetical protein GCM10025783_22410 [Amnibacterium soli]|uniref:Type 4 fimbrial biogenesis protein PilX N-terminal domain-containing protein n=1 Tax=Amnibacterium soli TaxID=1282736 RepID=A0ABP8Z8W6_9MICO
MMRRILRKRAGEEQEAGVALIVVVSLTAVMLIAIGTALTGATSGLRQAVSAQGSTRALDAAYAGVQDYIAKLNADSTYPQYGNPQAAFSSTSAVTLPRTANPAFSLDTGASSTWAPVPIPGGGAGSFRYEVDNSLYGSTGLLRIRATGRYASYVRTVVASVQQQGFINYLYFTDYETQDPAITGTRSNCASYLWSTASRSTSACSTIQFGARDVLAGPIRSNDTIAVCGATFNGSVTTSNPNAPIVATPSGCAAGTYNSGTPNYAPVLAMPATNTAMKAQTYADIATNPGCLYTGPTQITMNNDGTMTVVSPWSRATSVLSNGTAANNATPSQCGGAGALHSTKGATFQVPANNLIYVQSVPTNPADPNYTATTAVPDRATGSWSGSAAYTCTGSSGTSITGSSGSAGWNLTDSDGTVRYPLAGESPATNWRNASNSALWDTTTPAYGCRSGDAYVKGVVKGKVTIASDNYVYATGDITYLRPGNDVLGLVGNNGVLVWNPLNGSTPLLSGTGREIDAAILSPVHTFQVQNYNAGPPRGTLTMLGSIAQRFRGPVATTSGTTVATGYAKNYLYDARFSTVTPPYYLKPTSAAFKVGSYASTTAAFTATGVAS